VAIGGVSFWSWWGMRGLTPAPVHDISARTVSPVIYYLDSIIS
jgi:hypothetical protein